MVGLLLLIDVFHPVYLIYEVYYQQTDTQLAGRCEPPVGCKDTASEMPLLKPQPRLFKAVERALLSRNLVVAVC